MSALPGNVVHCGGEVKPPAVVRPRIEVGGAVGKGDALQLAGGEGEHVHVAAGRCGWRRRRAGNHRASRAGAILPPDRKAAGARHRRWAGTVQMSPPLTKAISLPSGERAGCASEGSGGRPRRSGLCLGAQGSRDQPEDGQKSSGEAEGARNLLDTVGNGCVGRVYGQRGRICCRCRRSAVPAISAATSQQLEVHDHACVEGPAARCWAKRQSWSRRRRLVCARRGSGRRGNPPQLSPGTQQSG